MDTYISRNAHLLVFNPVNPIIHFYIIRIRNILAEELRGFLNIDDLFKQIHDHINRQEIYLEVDKNALFGKVRIRTHFYGMAGD
ncbi:MAG: hypothetical protein K0Q48_3500 [Bacillota bacterium]|jgi:hypothetical protein|nr:hypothetical protein [Bacillota bacterium]